MPNAQPARYYLEIHCATCGRPMTLRVSVDCDPADAAALGRCVICPRCVVTSATPALVAPQGACGRIVHRGCPDDA
jgi:hypothetical protein